MTTFSLVILILAAIPCALTLVNLLFYRPAPRPVPSPDAPLPRVSVLIPARNEAGNIEAALRSVLANESVDLEVVVLDDASTDATPDIVRRLSEADQRVRLEAAPALPSGWCGKQHACHVLAGLAKHGLLVFMDADVRLAPDALGRMIAFLERNGAALASGIPHQLTGTWLERLLIPLIHFVLLGFLPFVGVRFFRHPMFSAGCGQVFIARRSAYEQAGGHAVIRSSLHDGIKLPRAFRRAGFRTDLVDITELATCRMYQGAREVWEGLAKNATEGMASAGAIGPMSLLLFGGQVLPFILLPMAPWLPSTAVTYTVVAVILAWLPRWIEAWRFRLSWRGAWLHPVGIFIFLVIQWMARVRAAQRRPSNWKGRAYPG